MVARVIRWFKNYSLLQRIVLLVLTAMILVFGVLNAAFTFKKGVVFHDTLLRRVTTEEAVTYFGEGHGESIRITVKELEANTTEVTYDIGDRYHDVCVIQRDLPPIQTTHGIPAEGILVTKNGATLFEGGYDAERGYWYGTDGVWDPLVEYDMHSVQGDYWDDAYHEGPESILHFAQGPELVHQGSWGLYVLCVVLTLLLAVDVMVPKLFFQAQHCCDVRDPEPSDFYLAMQKVAWVIYPLLLLAGYLFALTRLP